MQMTQIIPALFLLFILAPATTNAATADYYKCSYREGGEWNYGRTPNVCLASPFGSDITVTSDYPLLIFSDKASRSAERTRYTTEMYSLIRDASDYYMKKRKPTVSATELAQWKLLVQLTAAHESFMSHYRRTTDTRLKMMRGDVGHGHGMMQIDDRLHFNAINNGIAWRLITNLTYGMDILYAQWERALTQSCYKNASDKPKARIRSAWAAYNGGPGSICRWTNNKSVWVKNDQNFLDMYNDPSWKTYVASTQAPSSVNASCLIENKENCTTPGEDVELIAGKLYERPDGSVCAYLSGKFRCVREPRDTACLRALGNVDVSSATSIDAATASSVSSSTEDRHSLCEKFDATLFAVGETLKTVKAINLRTTPGGGLIKTVESNQTLEILDFEIRNHPVNDRYYKVKSGTSTGYLYAGDLSDYSAWAQITTPPTTLPAAVLRPGAAFTVVAPAGINMRTTPGGNLVTLVPRGTVLTVLDTVVQGTDNEVYYYVSYGSKKGYVYSGTLLPNTTSKWIQKK